PGVRVIATSREPLGAAGEHVVPVPPLQLPSAAESLSQLQQNEAMMLFTQRAAEASGTFELTSANRSVVVDICRRLDGLPLAIELAAVRTRILGVEQIRDRLSDRFGLLTTSSRAALPRHQTLRTTIDWSFDLLDDRERILLRRICVFAGRFTLDDAEAVCAWDDIMPDGLLDVLASLVDKSLVIKDDLNGVAGFRMHETMREYAAAKLEEAGEVKALGEQCTHYFWSRWTSAVDESRYRLAEWLEWTESEIDNIRAVLGHCLSARDVARGMDLATAVGWYWITRATTEGARWLDEFLALGPGNPETQFWAYFLRGFLAVLKSDVAAAGPALERAIATARELRKPNFLSHALSMGSIGASLAGDFASAARLHDEARLVTENLDDVSARISVLQATSLNGFFAGDIETVRAAAAEGVRLGRAVGDLYSLEMMLLNLGSTAFASGDFNEAGRLYREALLIARRIDDRVAEYALLDQLGCLAAAAGQARIAAQLIGAAETVRRQAGANLIAFLVPVIAQAEQAAVAAIGRARFDAEVEAGRQLERIDAIRLALGESPPTPTKPPDSEVDVLGKREADVARLVAEGLSNKQIGSRLFISERTVDSHVRSILNKLGFSSRAQIAGWMASARHNG
ncbi:MAG TPA: LuxR C-terminal-related transcriptional regulator, partial [Candidatus Acidoferrum sp.]|nr:LuxR C-terminal-related transcriptional regulator [Candidatus Acidoferrum sp.]